MRCDEIGVFKLLNVRKGGDVSIIQGAGTLIDD